MHGIDKFEHMSNITQLLRGIGLPFSAYAAPGLALLEVLGGACLILGIGTRIFALLLAIVMLVTILKVKLNQGFPSGYQFELLLLAALVSLILSGPGALALGRR